MKDWKLVNFCEFDKYATKSYCAIHNVDESLNLGDITKVDETKLEPFNMICGGSPCQDFSLAGKRSGSVWTCKDCGHEYNPLTVHWSKRDKCPNCDSENIDKTRSSLLVEYLRIIRANKPNFGIYENVKNIVGKQFKDTFKMFTGELEEYGYSVHWKILNAKDYGVPQNRERVYLIFIKKELDNGNFKFPEGFDSGIRLRDILEDDVDEKFYLTDSNIKTYSREFGSKGKQLDLDSISPTLTASMGTGGGNMPFLEEPKNKKLRKITPKEAFRIMGFSDKNFNCAKGIGISNSQLYKQAGNSIVVDVLYYILVELYTAMSYLFDDLRLSSFFSGIGAFEIALNRLYESINTGNFTNPQAE